MAADARPADHPCPRCQPRAPRGRRGDRAVARGSAGCRGRHQRRRAHRRAARVRRRAAGRRLRAAVRGRRVLRGRRRGSFVAAVPRCRPGGLRRGRPRRGAPRAAAGHAVVVLHLPRVLVGPGEQIVERCRELAGVSEEPGRLTRRYATPAMARANALVGGWMAEAGMAVRVDAAGNLVGHRPGAAPAAGTLLLGSHLDTVRDAGAFDGPLGVLTAVALVQRLREERVALPFAIDVLGFADEEGLRFGTAYLGSRALAGTFDRAMLDVVDDDGVSV